MVGFGVAAAVVVNVSDAVVVPPGPVAVQGAGRRVADSSSGFTHVHQHVGRAG